ncbi:DUF4142 domain-containing protein [Pedobacter sp. SYP-B3415]|uniref:DUF4142 domain-containing protein n=1 Tax=Pedobacter sp. SYP-B3415 TaxID=2496641 RepID=UPI00101C8B72|nr:DUF4142 domain-containing protein [Pedobacter sp. SYP-B3415]
MKKIASTRRRFLFQSSVAAVATTLGVTSSFNFSANAAGTSDGVLADTPKEYLTKIAPHVFLSLATSTIAVKKASHELVKKFAGFEMTETKGFSQILQEMGVPAPPMTPKGEQVLKDMQKETGKAFDLRFLSAQAETHAALEDLTAAFLRSPGDDKHTKHVAMAALPAIREHLDHCKMLLALAAK